MFGWIASCTGKQKAVAMGMGAVLLGILVYVGLLMPQLGRITALTAQYQRERQQMDTLKAYAVQHPDPEQHLRELERKVSFLAEKLPDQPEIGEFLKEVEQVAKRSGVDLRGVKPLNVQNKDGYREFPIEVQLSATYMNLLEFMRLLEDTRRFNLVVDMNIQASQGNLDTKLILAIYSNGVVANAPPQPLPNTTSKQ